MSKGFRGFSQPAEDKELKLYIRKNEVDKLIKEYKSIKKYKKSNIFEIAKLFDKETKVDKLLEEYGINPEALE